MQVPVSQSSRVPRAQTTTFQPQIWVAEGLDLHVQYLFTHTHIQLLLQPAEPAINTLKI